MKSRSIAVLAGSFFGAALVGSAVSCGCDCPDTPARPRATPPLTIEMIDSPELSLLGGVDSTLPDGGIRRAIMPSSGTLEVTGEEVILVYQQDDVEHRVVYSVHRR